MNLGQDPVGENQLLYQRCTCSMSLTLYLLNASFVASTNLISLVIFLLLFDLILIQPHEVDASIIPVLHVGNLSPREIT